MSNDSTRTLPATQADDALVEELARKIVSFAYGAFEHGYSAEYGPAEPNDNCLAAARAILPILHRERAAAEQKAKEYWYRQGRDDAWQSGYDAGRA